MRNPIALIPTVVGAAALLLLPACTSGPKQKPGEGIIPDALREKSEVRGGEEFKLPGRRVFAEMNLVERGQRLAIVNSGSTKPTEVYSREATPGVALKVASDDTMARFCEALRRLEFYQFVEREAPAGALWSISLDVDGDKKTIYHVRGRAPERHVKIQNIQRFFSEAFNTIFALQAVDAKKGGADMFSSQKQRLDAENARIEKLKK